MRSISILALAATSLLGAPAMAQDSEYGPPPVQSDAVAPQITPPPAGMGQVVFYRPGGMGPLVSCRVSEGDKVVNRLPPGRYFVQTTAPGVHQYSVHSEATDILRINVEEGETQYARCSIRMGIMVGRPNLSSQDRADFEKRGRKLKLQGPFDEKGKDKAKDDKEPTMG
jgi:hypothetical protein